jgi:hypothetical protein
MIRKFEPEAPTVDELRLYARQDQPDGVALQGLPGFGASTRIFIWAPGVSNKIATRTPAHGDKQSSITLQQQQQQNFGMLIELPVIFFATHSEAELTAMVPRTESSTGQPGSKSLLGQ